MDQLVDEEGEGGPVLSVEGVLVCSGGARSLYVILVSGMGHSAYFAEKHERNFRFAVSSGGLLFGEKREVAVKPQAGNGAYGIGGCRWLGGEGSFTCCMYILAPVSGHWSVVYRRAVWWFFEYW